MERCGGSPRADVEAGEAGIGGFCLDETRSPRARRSTCRSRGWEQRFKRHTGLVEVASEAGVARGRAVRRRAWFLRRLGSSRVNESDLWTVMTPKQAFALGR